MFLCRVPKTILILTFVCRHSCLRGNDETGVFYFNPTIK